MFYFLGTPKKMRIFLTLLEEWKLVLKVPGLKPMNSVALCRMQAVPSSFDTIFLSQVPKDVRKLVAGRQRPTFVQFPTPRLREREIDAK